MLLYNYQQTDIVRKLELSTKTVSKWMKLIRQVLEHWEKHSSEKIGVGEVVEIHETKFGKRKYHKVTI